MTIINADKFLAYLIFSKHIDGLTCGEVKEAVEMCKVDVFDKIRSEIEQEYKVESAHPYGQGLRRALEIIDKHTAEGSEE